MAWNQKPPLGRCLNFGNHFSKHLIGCWIMNVGSGSTIKDLSNNQKPFTIASGSNVYWSGGGLYFTGTAQSVSTPSIMGGLNNWSIMLGFRTLQTTTCIPLELSVNTNTYYTFYLSLNDGASGRLHFATRMGAGSTYNAYYSLYNNDGRFVNAIVSNDQTQPAALEKQFNVNYYTLKTEVFSNEQTTQLPAGHSLYLGSRGGSSLPFQGWIDHLMIWDKAFSAEETVSLQLNPYQMFEPSLPVWAMYTAPSGGLSIPVAMHHYLRH